jgi:iron complex transport system substrate-binding protein
MKLNEHIMLWNHASVKVMDIRYAALGVGERLASYRLPANAFLFALRGSARIRLDGALYCISRFHILHGGRGSSLEMEVDDGLEYYLILYKALLIGPSAWKQKHQSEENQPFRHQYCFVPLYPLPLLDKLEQMFQDWMKRDPLAVFHARGLFHQFVHELLWQMRRQGIEPEPPDLLGQALRYLHEHYREPVTLESMAEMFDCSVSYLTKLFKRRINESPIRLLTRIRMERAAELLAASDYSLQETAELVGYPDAHTLSRSFKKYCGLPPAQYRARSRTEGGVPDLPRACPQIALVADFAQCYSFSDYENCYQLKRSGGGTMHQASKTASAAAATLLLCITVLLAACSGASSPGNIGASGNGATAPGSSQQTNATPQPTVTAEATKSYRDSKGTVTIPAHPERIVDLTGSAIGNLLKLGIKPVAALDYGLESPFHDGMLDGVVNLGAQPNPEAILSLNPDLIVSLQFLDEAQYEALTKIAPVVRLELGKGTPSDMLLEFGKLTGREKEAQEWVEQWDRKIAELKPRIVQAVGDKTVSILQPHDKGIYAWGNKGGRSGEIIHGYLGLKAPAMIEQELIAGSGFGKSFTLEQLPEYAGDYIFTSPFSEEGNPGDLYENSLWKSLPAVKHNQVFFFDQKGAYYNDPISLEAQLEFVVKSLLGPAS